MSYASLLGLPDSNQVSAWWSAWAEAEQEFGCGQLEQRAWEWDDDPTYEPVGAAGFAVRYPSGAVTVGALGPIFSDMTGDAAVCGDRCACCRQREPALRAGIWTVAQIVEHLL
jgi:hypothetical protein